MTFELLLHAAFVADEIWGDTLEPARTHTLFMHQLATAPKDRIHSSTLIHVVGYIRD